MVLSPPIQVANLGITDSLILMVLALVVVGPRRLPEIGRKVGKLMYEFRKASNDFKFQMEEELRASEEAERRRALEARQAEDHKRLLALEAAVNNPEDKPQAPQEGNVESGAAASAETAPRIQPPSTGAPVEAARPGRMADAANAMAEMAIDSALNPLPPSPQAPSEPSSEAAEPEVHHG